MNDWSDKVEVIRVDVVPKEPEFLYQINIWNSSTDKFLETFDSFNTSSETLKFITYWLNQENYRPVSNYWSYASVTRTRKFRKVEA